MLTKAQIKHQVNLLVSRITDVVAHNIGINKIVADILDIIPDNAVTADEQTFTEEQQAQARYNIGALGAEDIEGKADIESVFTKFRVVEDSDDEAELDALEALEVAGEIEDLTDYPFLRGLISGPQRVTVEHYKLVEVPPAEEGEEPTYEEVLDLEYSTAPSWLKQYYGESATVLYDAVFSFFGHTYSISVNKDNTGTITRIS